MNNNLIVKEFNGNEIHTFVWNNKPCWIANEIVSIFDYADPSKTIQDCISAEEFELGVEYDLLKGDNLKAFKELVGKVTTSAVVTSLKFVPQLTIFYEDGLYGFLQYTDKPIGVQFRKWIRRDVLPEIRQTGAYITNKADPEMLRAKANEIESLTILNETAKIMLPVFDEAGLKPEYKALALKQIYRKAGIDLPIEGLKAEREIFDLTSIAAEVGIYSNNDKPHGQAISAIVSQLDIADNEKEVVNFEKNGHMGTTVQYTRSVIDKVKQWIADNGYPAEIRTTDSTGKSKTYKVSYKKEAVVC